MSQSGGRSGGPRESEPASVAEPGWGGQRAGRPQPDTQLSLGLPGTGVAGGPGATARAGSAELLARRRFAAQRRLGPRTPLTDERIAAVLEPLAPRGEASCCVRARPASGMAPARLSGTLAALALLLNVEGYPILAVDEASDTSS